MNKNKPLQSQAPADLEFLTRADAARIAHVTTQTVDAWHERGMLPTYRPGDGRRVLIRLSEFVRFLEAGKQ